VFSVVSPAQAVCIRCRQILDRIARTHHEIGPGEAEVFYSVIGHLKAGQPHEAEEALNEINKPHFARAVAKKGHAVPATFEEIRDKLNALR
jgi:hypothetical protein